MGVAPRSFRSLSALRRHLRRTVVRRRSKNGLRLSLGQALLSSFLLSLFLLLLPRPQSLIFSDPLASLHLPTVSRQSPAEPAARYAPLLHAVDAIVGKGTSARATLVEAYQIPPIVVANMSLTTASRLYWKLVYADVVTALRAHHTVPINGHPHQQQQPTFEAAARVLFIHTQNGLGNRLRALASGLALARATGRVPVIVWERDAHLGASFHHLFETRAFGSDIETVLYRDLVVIESFPEWELVRQPSDHWYPVNYMLKDGSGTAHKLMRFNLPKAESPRSEPANWMDSMGGLTAPPDKITVVKAPAAKPAHAKSNIISSDAHLYFKSAYVAITHPRLLSAPHHVNRELMNLQPSKAVLKIFETQDRGELDKAVGIHIRSRTLANDNVAVDTNCEYTATGAETTNYWRSRSQLPVFINRMRALTFSRKDQHTKFFVAVDNVELLQKLQKVFPGRIFSIPRECDDRDESCVVYAMADLLCLSRTRKIFGSNWSSFTEAAARLGNKKVYLSGVDFGKAPKTKRESGRKHRSLWDRLSSWLFRRKGKRKSSPPASNPFPNCRSRT